MVNIYQNLSYIGTKKKNNTKQNPVIIYLNLWTILPVFNKSVDCYATWGLAMNIVDCVSKLGTKTFMINALGLDIPASNSVKGWFFSNLIKCIRGWQIWPPIYDFVEISTSWAFYGLMNIL